MASIISSLIINAVLSRSGYSGSLEFFFCCAVSIVFNNSADGMNPKNGIVQPQCCYCRAKRIGRGIHVKSDTRQGLMSNPPRRV